ncbi:universal stress protein UspA [Pontibacillus litoralis JSM 072002]|uniref:Universal stress protein UspA n=1 Tax=Pontibacillus litoralis JSM 072002 TaxID=1385512 RepID=A0A0A5HR04_9BACI|nr:universal stress protein UspA [Pontibacillus litoralis JSM 072002]
MLVAYDGSKLSKQALQEAMNRADENPETEIHVVTVVNPTGPFTNKTIYKSIEDELRKDSKVELAKLVEQFKREDQHIETEVLTGNPGAQICKYAKNNDITLIMIGSRGLRNVKELFLGSVSHNVVQHAHCPVLIFK